MNDDMQEREYKWKAQSICDYDAFLKLAALKGAKISKVKNLKIKDLYLDTSENFFKNVNLTCRLRFCNGQFELTLKSLPTSKKELFIRDEKTIRFPLFQTVEEALEHCRLKFFKNISPLFEILNNRKIHILTLACGTQAESSFDQVLISCGEKKIRMHEIELEFKCGDFEKIKAFVRKLSSLALTPSFFSKFQVAMRHLPKNFNSCNSFGEDALFFQIVRKNLIKLKKNESIFQKHFSPDAIHDMRVAARRLRAVIKIFQKNIPDAKRIRKELKHLGRILGKARDFDVFSDFIHGIFRNNSLFFEKLSQKRDKLKKSLISMLNSKKYASLLDSLDQLKTKETSQNGFKMARNEIRKKLNRVLKIGLAINSEIDNQTLHQLRISIKKLRYACEFFEPIFKKHLCSLTPFIQKTKKIQDALGSHQDAVAGNSVFSRYRNQFSVQEFFSAKEKFEQKKMRSRKIFMKLWKDYWVGKGFSQLLPTNAIELIL